MTERAGGPRAPAPRLYPVAAIGLLAAFLLADVLFRGRVFYYRDIHLWWLGVADEFVRTVTAGSWPLWNRWPSFGQSMIGNPNMQVLYPVTWLNLLMLPSTYYTSFIALHLVFAGAGAYRLGRRLDLSRTAATLAGGVWIASGPLLSLINIHNHFAGAAWIAWSGWAADRALASGRAAAAAVWAVALTAPVLLGSAESALMAVAIGIVIGLRHLPTRGIRAMARIMTIAAVFALSLSAIQWIPTVELARRSIRLSFDAAHKSYWSAPPLGLVQTIVPASLGTLPLEPALRSRLLGSTREPFFLSLYLGLATLPLVLVGWHSRRVGMALGALFIGCLLIALGSYGPLYAVLLHLPLRFPVKTMTLAALAWALSAGLGLDALRTAPRHVVRPVRVLAAVLGILVGAGALLLRFGAETYGPAWLTAEAAEAGWSATLLPVWRSLMPAAALSLGVAFLLTTMARRRLDASWPAALALLAVSDPALAHRRLNGTTERAVMSYRPPTLEHVLDRPPLSRVYSYEYDLPGDFTQRHLGHKRLTLRIPIAAAPGIEVAAQRQILDPGVVAQWGIETAYSFDKLGLSSADMVDLTWFLRTAEGGPTHLRLLQMGAVSRMVALHADGLSDLKLRAELPTLFFETVKVFEVPDPLPRAYAVDGVRVGGHDAAFAALSDPAFDPRREVILPDGSPHPARPDFRGRVQILSLRPDRVALEATLSHAGFVVLVDAFDPGWKATIDGHPTPVLRANVAFQSVAVPDGLHRIELAYRPWSAVLGLLVSAIGAAVALLVSSRAVAPARGAL